MTQIRHHFNTKQPFLLLLLLLLFTITLPRQASAIPNPFPLFITNNNNNNSQQQTRRNLSLTQPQTTTTKESHYSSVVTGDAAAAASSPSTTGNDEDDEYTDDAATSEDDNRPERCFATSECTLCEYGKVEGVCKATGRRQKFDCSTGGDTWRTVYRGCLRTVQDEEWLMLRLQMICGVVAMISLMSTKRQKRVSASLFDQRRGKALMRMGNAANRRGGGGSAGSGGDGGSGEDEMVPLNPSLGESETV